MIRAITLFAYLDTPYRFGKKNRLWKYCGVGLVHNTSGRDKYGRPKPGRLKLAWRVNKRLKNAILGAATSAINHKDNVFKDYYERMVENGVTNSNARPVAKELLSDQTNILSKQRIFGLTQNSLQVYRCHPTCSFLL